MYLNPNTASDKLDTYGNRRLGKTTAAERAIFAPAVSRYSELLVMQNITESFV
jgi:hypothetical protein